MKALSIEFMDMTGNRQTIRFASEGEAIDYLKATRTTDAQMDWRLQLTSRKSLNSFNSAVIAETPQIYAFPAD